MKKLINIISIALLIVGWNESLYAVNSWQFEVYYGDQQIGEHHFNAEKVGDMHKIMIEADFNIDILFINVYSYKHKNIEIWKDACLSSIESTTDDNGEKFKVVGMVNDDVFKVDTKHGIDEIEGCVNTFAYWDMRFLDSDYLLNSQTGEIVDVEISFISTEKILVRNKMLSTKRYKVKSDDFNIDLWYSESGDWVALNSTTQDGTTLRYQIK
ncbi:MAG: DUF6134 family protein [Gammaproteobacteria bacterium]|nr:DUF6134 family protein [Gammaproteobacteria bacterium]